jgi:acyl-CoA dehydrogenase
MSENDQQLFALPSRYVQLITEATELATSVASHAPVADESDAIDPVMRNALSESGLAKVAVASEFGGRFDQVDALAVTVVRECLAGVSAHLDSLFAMQGIGSYALSVGGSVGLCQEWLPKVAQCTAIAALALTEPGVGSDLKALSTTLTEQAGYIVINGHKSFITNAGYADFYVVLGREGEGFSLVLVPTTTPGLRVTSPDQIIAPHVLGDVHFSEVRVPVENRIGEPSKGFALILATLATFRVSVAGAAVGVAQTALNEALRHTTTRVQFGGTLSDLGSVSQGLALSWTEIEMARSFSYAAAAAAQRDPLGSLHLSSMAKVGATEMCGRVVDRAVQSMGRFGLIRGSVIERLYRGARPMRIYEGSTEVLLDSLARQLVKKTRAAVAE